MMIRLDPPIPLWTPKGVGLAHFVTDYGIETNLTWTVFLKCGEIWSFQNPQVRAISNETAGRYQLDFDEDKEAKIRERFMQSRDNFFKFLDTYKEMREEKNKQEYLERERKIEEREKEVEERIHYGWNAFPQEWPESSLEICMVKFASDPDEEYLAKIDTLFGQTREDVIVFNIKNMVTAKQFVYKRGQPHSLGFDQIVGWRRLK